MALQTRMAERARTAGPVTPGRFRVVVLESKLTWTWHDFDTLEAAQGYADDVVSESDDNPPIAGVFDSSFALVSEGRHYASR